MGVSDESLADWRTPKVAQLMAICARDTPTLAKSFFPERFSQPFSDAIHRKIFDLIDGPDKLVAIAAPRGFGKTSCVALALLARHILFRLTPFIMYINHSFDAASLHTENLKRELVANKMIKYFFGDVKPNADVTGYEESFSKKAWVAFDTLVWPRGMGQTVRGLSHGNNRPGLIVIDDLEDSDMVTNAGYREKGHEWLYADVMKCVPQMGPAAENYKIVYIDTLKHEDSILQRLLDDPAWKSIRLEACDDNFVPTAPEFYPAERIESEWKRYSNAGKADVFFREMRNLPISSKDAVFQPDYFRYYNLLPNQVIREGKDIADTESDIAASVNLETVVIVDPAKTAKMSSAESAIVCVGLDLPAKRYYVRDINVGHWMPDELYANAFNMAQTHGAYAIGWEVSGLEEFIKQPVMDAMLGRGLFFELVWLRARGGQGEEKGKALRIQALSPYYRTGQIFHNKQCANIGRLEEQLLMFPRSRLWDIMDATAYLVEMAMLGGRNFFQAENPDATSEEEYNELRYEDPIDDWRII